MNILPEVFKEKDCIIGMREHLHKNPELSLKEYKTAEYIRQQLSSFGIESMSVGETGVLASVKGEKGPGKTVLLRADIDALPMNEIGDKPYCSNTPGVMHACGHDVHTAALLGAAKILQSKKKELAGTVYFVFQQAEEFGHGSQYFLGMPFLKHIDRGFGVHVIPEYPVGTVVLSENVDAASCHHFRITVKGRSAHVASPQYGTDALKMAHSILSEIHTLKERTLSPFESAVLYVGSFTAGKAFNIVPESAVLEGSIRTFSDEAGDKLKAGLVEICESVSKIYGGEAEAEIETFANVIRNDETALKEFIEAAEPILGKEHIEVKKEPVMGFTADDVGEFLRLTKGVYAHVGSSNQEDMNTQAKLHSNNFDVDKNTVLVAASLHVAYALYNLEEKNG